MFYYDPLWMLATGIGLIVSLWAQWRVKSAFGHYSRIPIRNGMTGAEAAAAVARAGNAEVRIERHQGFLSDHYDPRSRTLRLSPDVHDGHSISSIAVAAHEAGHAIQHVVAYPALGFRSVLVPVANIGTHLWWLPFAIGAGLLGTGKTLGSTFMLVGIAMFAGGVLFQLVTLPVEFDASRRAKAVLAQSGIVQTSDEARGVEKVLDAAAWTYIAAAAASVLQLLVLILRFQQGRREQ